MGRSWVILILLVGNVSAQESFYNFGEGFSIAENQDATVVGYRVHTAASLMEFTSRSALIDRLVVSPAEISIPVGQALDLGQVRVTALDVRGRIVEEVPLAFPLEGPEDLLDFEGFRAEGRTITDAKSGMATIWVESLPPSRSGEVIRESIKLIVE